MGLQIVILVGVVCLAAGLVVGWLVARSRGTASPRGRHEDVWTTAADAVPYSATPDEFAVALRNILDQHTDLALLAVYAGQGDDESLWAFWRDDVARMDGLPAIAPATLILQLPGPTLVDTAELGKGLRPGLPPADPTTEASQLEAERVADEQRVAETMFENPFELEDESLTQSAIQSPPLPPTGNGGGTDPVDAAQLAARLIAVPWSGAFAWRGVIVARPGADPMRHFSDVGRAAASIGPRLAVHCELSRAAKALARAAEVRPMTEYVLPVAEEPHAPIELPPIPTPPAPVPSPVAARLHRAEVRMADALQSPRREPDLLRNAVGLLAEGLATDRCYVVEIEGLHTKPVAHERRSEAVASAAGLDFGTHFLASVRSRSATTIKAIVVQSGHSGELLSEEVSTRLGPMSRVLVPVVEKGHVSAVYVCEWIDPAKRLTDDDIAFAERVVARASVACERLHQYDALAQQAAHAREAQEEVEEALTQIQSLVSALPEALVGLDTDGTITFANRAAGRYFRKQEFELIGRSVVDLVRSSGGDATAWERAIGAATTDKFAATMTTTEGRSTVDITVVPGLQTAICDRLITLSVRANAES
jgi:PAS domain-containing protein